MLQSINIFSLLEEHVSLLFALEKRDLNLDEIFSSPFLPLPHLSSSFSGRGAPQSFQIFQGFCKTRQPAKNKIKPLKELELSFTNTCSSNVEQFENSVINASSMTALSAILLQDLLQNYKILTQNQALHYVTNIFWVGQIITKDKKDVKNSQKHYLGFRSCTCVHKKNLPVCCRLP